MGPGGDVVIVATAVVPAAPALITELMAGAAPEVEPVRRAARAAIAQVCSRLAGPGGRRPLGRLVVVGAADGADEAGSRSYDLGGPVTDATFGPLLQLDAIPGAPPEFSAPDPARAQPTVAGESRGLSVAVPTPLLVARRLAADAIQDDRASAPVWAEALWLTLTPQAVADYARSLVHDDAPIGVILVADGAACHGPKAPRAEDPRAQDYDDAVCRALASADPADWVHLDPALGRELAAEGADLWPLLAAAAGAVEPGSPAWRAQLQWRGAPYGVGWFVATWLR